MAFTDILFDLNHPGRRKFLVTTYEDFWTRYLTMQDDERVYYELIREEYPKDLNQDSDSEAMMKIFKKRKVVLRELFTKFKIHVEANEWIEMTSDTDKKFSRHVIVDLKNAACIQETAISASCSLQNSGKTHHSSKLTQNPPRTSCPKGLDAFLRTLVGAVGSWTPGMRVLAIDGSTTTSGGRGDDHVAKKVRGECTGGGNARVQRVAFFPDSITVTYAMVGTRYCYNIGKEHKSNGVYYVAEISHGIFSQRSREVEIPVELNPFKTENDTPPESSNGDGNNEATDDEDAPMGP
ncbi:hypothetical protein BC829DRAFT_463263 [Chytridium lagenaria]|nr:hypothetical protein BC829DRAFT_463263 [Chytridium lagenaria]